MAMLGREHLSFLITCAQDHSASRAVDAASSAGNLASWEHPQEKAALITLGQIAKTSSGNKLRDLSRKLGSHGFMLNIPIAQLPRVPWHKVVLYMYRYIYIYVCVRLCFYSFICIYIYMA